MSTNQTTTQVPEVVNGIEINKVMSVINNINADANNGKWQRFGASRWKI
jgi:hypothetical protein